jgi:hypothetical protein
MRKIGLAILVGTLLAVGGVTAASAATVQHPHRCGSHGTVRLDDNANGHHVRVCKGATITVALHAPMADPPDTWWQPITVQPEQGRVLQALPQRILPPRGVTVAAYKAAHRGSAALRSSRRVCPVNPSGPACHAVAFWHVDIDVR